MDKELNKEFNKAVASYEVAFEELANILMRREDNQCLFYLGEITKAHKEIYQCVYKLLNEIKK